MAARKSQRVVTPQRLQHLVHYPLDDDFLHIRELKSMRIELDPKDFSNCPPWFQTANLKRIQVTLQKEFAAPDTTKSKTRYLHQSIVTTEHLHHQHSYDVFYAKTLEKARNLLRTQIPASKTSTMVLLPYHLNTHPFQLARAYDLLTHECAQIYPTRSEVIFEEAKSYDVKALDAIAEVMKTFRPITCYPDTPKCPLSRNTTTIMKRKL